MPPVTYAIQFCYSQFRMKFIFFSLIFDRKLRQVSFCHNDNLRCVVVKAQNEKKLTKFI